MRNITYNSLMVYQLCKAIFSLLLLFEFLNDYEWADKSYQIQLLKFICHS